MPELRLNRGVTANMVTDALRNLVTDARNIAGGSGGTDPLQLGNHYLQWVETAERVLRSYFSSPWVLDLLHGARYSEIRSINKDTVRPKPLISMEAETQAEHLEAIVSRLQREVASFELPDGAIAVVPDTNVLMHYQRYDQIDWPTECRAESVRLVLPLLVIDELDGKSYNSSPRGERVKNVLRSLEEIRGSAAPDVPVPVRAGVEYQVLMDPEDHQRRANNDDEILSRVERLAELVGTERVLVVTGDRGMKLRASTRGLPCQVMPDRLRIHEGTSKG